MCAMVAVVVLAAGASSRFGSPKQQVLLAPVLERVRKAPSVSEIVVVVGAHAVSTDARTIHCADWADGPGASLRCGLAALPTEAEAAVVLGRPIWSSIPDEGARELDPVLIPCDDLGPPGDVDTPADLSGRASETDAE